MNVDIIAVPFDSGIRDWRMGCGPGHLLDAGLVRALEDAGATVSVSVVEPRGEISRAEIGLSFEIQRLVATAVAEAKERGSFPLVLSGNCNTAVGTVGGLTLVRGESPAVCWLDAHGDFNTPETTMSGFLDGMAVAMLAGRCWRSLTSTVPGFKPVPESQILMVGTRDLNDVEARNLESSNVVRCKSSEAADRLESPREIYLHVDLDVFDTSEGTANGYAVEGGISRASFMSLAADLQAKFQTGAMAITAYDPSCDPENRIARLATDVAVAVATGTTLS